MLSVQRDDHVWFRINTDHIVSISPQGNQPSHATVLLLSSGDKIKLKDSFTDFLNKPEVKKFMGE